MTRLIDVDALIETMRENAEGNEGWYGDTWAFMRDVESAPTIDAVPVVRCRDCRWWNDGTQMCGITISATPYGHCHDGETWEEAERKDIPSADRPQEWIPCSERLPEERQDVYVTVFWDDYGDTITAYGMRTRFGWLLWNTAEGELIKGYTVTAWMPLPKPYAGERKDDE